MEAARIAALRGHEVMLYAKEYRHGGLLPLAALVKGIEIEDYPALVRYFETQLTKLGVDVRLGREVEPSLIEEIKPDVVILATGGKLLVPEIPGINRKNVVTSMALHRQVNMPLRLFGPRLLRWITKLWMPIGKRVIIVGGLMHGCELAEFLVKRGRKVTVLEASNQLGTGIIERTRIRLLNWLARKGATMLTGVRFEEITAKGISITTKEGERRSIEADTILVITPPVPNSELFTALKGRVPEVHMIGDCKEPHSVLEAIADGFRIGHTI